MKSIFAGRTMLLPTKHGKEVVIAPILEQELGVKMIVDSSFDTDQYGTFTRTKKRLGTQKEAGIRKLKHAMRLHGADLGVASEGSFGPHPSIPFVASNIELLVLIDTKNDLEIVGHAASLKTNFAHAWATTANEAVAFAKKIGFPKHNVILRKNENHIASMSSDFQSEDAIHAAAESLLGRPFIKKVFIETDMRANRNPMRMEAIREATLDLVKACKHICTRCEKPGVQLKKVLPGALCRLCSLPTDVPRAEVYECSACKKETVVQLNVDGDPRHCNRCNP